MAGGVVGEGGGTVAKPPRRPDSSDISYPSSKADGYCLCCPS